MRIFLVGGLLLLLLTPSWGTWQEELTMVLTELESSFDEIELWIWITMHDDRDYDWDAFLPVDIDQKHGLYNLLSKRAELKKFYLLVNRYPVCVP